MAKQPISYLLRKTTFDQILELIVEYTTFEQKGDHVEVTIQKDNEQVQSLLETFCKRDSAGFTPRTEPSKPGTAYFE